MTWEESRRKDSRTSLWHPVIERRARWLEVPNPGAAQRADRDGGALNRHVDG
jgi:hypothetical protein